MLHSDDPPDTRLHVRHEDGTVEVMPSRQEIESLLAKAEKWLDENDDKCANGHTDTDYAEMSGFVRGLEWTLGQGDSRPYELEDREDDEDE